MSLRAATLAPTAKGTGCRPALRTGVWGAWLASSLAVVLLSVQGAEASAAEASGAEGSGAEVERRLGLMGTEATVRVEASTRASGLEASERAIRALEEAEARLSTWRTDSELARLNATPVGQGQALSPELGRELAAAMSCSRETGGAFDPTVGALVAAWGLRGEGRKPTQEDLAAAREATGLSLLRLVSETSASETPAVRAVRLHPGLRLEEGGMGKGAGLVQALKELQADPKVVRAYLDLGGQVALWSRQGEGSWRVAVAHPRHRQQPVVTVDFPGGSLATSGTSEKGQHILDPRTGEPAPAFGSVTVWTEDPLRADCLSTGLFVLGPLNALDWAASHPGVEVLVLEERAGRLWIGSTPGLASRLEVVAPGADLEIWNHGSAPAAEAR